MIKNMNFSFHRGSLLTYKLVALICFHFKKIVIERYNVVRLIGQ